MKKIMSLLLYISIIMPIAANDMGFMGSGNHLIPLENNPIRLDKEILNITWNEEKLNFDINVQFSMYNPKEELNIDVGFTNPKSRMERNNKESIDDFTVICNGQKLEYSVVENEKIKNSLIDDLYQGPFYIYKFPCTFKKGINKIEHHYSFGGVTDAKNNLYVDYILMSALNWSNSTIGDFELNIKLKPRSIVALINKLDESHSWQFRGPIKTSDYFDKTKLYFYTQSGEFKFKAKNFVPLNNLTMMINPKSDISWYMSDWCGKSNYDWYTLFFIRYGLVGNLKMIDLTVYDKNQLRLLRSTLYALKGYRFKSNDLFQFFDQFIWYLPDDSVDLSIEQFSGYDRKFIQDIIEIEKTK